MSDCHYNVIIASRIYNEDIILSCIKFEEEIMFSSLTVFLRFWISFVKFLTLKVAMWGATESAQNCLEYYVHYEHEA